MTHAVPFQTERPVRARNAVSRAEKVRNLHLMSIGLGTLVGLAAPDMFTGTLLGVATVKSIELATRQVALLGIALWVNK